MLAAADHAEFHHTGDLLSKAHTARAVYAARHVRRNQRAEILVYHYALVFFVKRAARAVADGEILQLAFAALIADRAIQRMVNQQKFHHALLRGDGLIGMRLHLHAVGDRRCTGRQRLGRFLHLHQTHAAIGGNRQFAVITEMRHVNTRQTRGIHHRAAVGHFQFVAVDFNL